MRRGACSVERQQYVMACIKGMENDSDAAPPSVFADMPTISLLEAVVTKDPRWHWLEAAWDASEDESARELASFVREHRATLANELAGHVRQVVARPGSNDELSE
jgi:sugar phosphate isomerase/epimerase